MASRLELHEELVELLGSRNVYYQPPESKKIEYDCIVYRRRDVWIRHADDYKYLYTNCYELTVIYRDPDLELTDEILKHFKYCNFERSFDSDNLHHDILTLYY